MPLKADCVGSVVESVTTTKEHVRNSIVRINGIRMLHSFISCRTAGLRTTISKERQDGKNNERKVAIRITVAGESSDAVVVVVEEDGNVVCVVSIKDSGVGTETGKDATTSTRVEQELTDCTVRHVTV